MKEHNLRNSDNMDANEIKCTGIYRGHSMQNVPSQGEVTLIHIKYNNKGHQETQLPDGTYISRWQHKGSWTPWRDERGYVYGESKEIIIKGELRL